jgi:adenine phosphoribosyltransferase
MSARTPDPAAVPDAELRRALARIRDIPDFPEPGIIFKDITPLLADAGAFGAVVNALAASAVAAGGVDAVVGIEARGFILAAPVALALQAAFVPVRKAGKLPGRTFQASYTLEYGQATLEIQEDALAPGARVLLVDDVLATGGTVTAAARLIGDAGATVTAVAVLLELGFLPGRARLGEAGLDRVTALETI